jgi:NADH-quinone oxidoreductase subunit L
MPITFATMLIASLAISGVPLFSGFLEDEILLVLSS